MRPITLAKTATAALATALVGGLASRPAQSNWYEQLRKPSFQPPRQAFPIVWPILYTGIAVVSARTIDRLRTEGRQDQARAYTVALAGNLAVNADGQMVTADGYPIEPSITVPAEATAIQITRDGIVEVTLAGQTDPQQIGQLEIASFINPAGLEGIGDNLFLETPASGTATTATPGSPGLGTLMQGFLENSNVNAVEEISSLIVAQRAYEMNARVITAADEMLQSTTQLR